MFQFPGLATCAYGFSTRQFGHPGLNARLTAPPGISQSSHALPRLLAPRHPPRALSSLAALTQPLVRWRRPDLAGQGLRLMRRGHSLSYQFVPPPRSQGGGSLNNDLSLLSQARAEIQQTLDPSRALLGA